MCAYEHSVVAADHRLIVTTGQPVCDAYCGMPRRLVCRQNQVKLGEWVIVTKWLTAATEVLLS